jgi:hypothetical protein
MAEYLHGYSPERQTEDKRKGTAISHEDIIKVLSNPVGLKLFKFIATSTFTDAAIRITSDFLQSQTKVTRKQFYSNMSRLVNETGLISRKHRHYALSNYGKIVFHSLNIINRGSKYFWALEALDNDEFSSAGIPMEQVLEISASLIEDEEIRRIICGPMMIDRPKKDVVYEPPYDQRGAGGQTSS